MQNVGPGPGHPVEGQQSQRPAGDVDPVAHRVGAEQAGILLGPEDVDQRSHLQRIDMLGVEGQALVGQGPGDPLMHRLEPPDGGEQPQAPAAGGQEQLPHRRPDLPRVVLGHVGDHQRQGVGGIVEWRGQLQRLGPFGQARRPGAHLGHRERIDRTGVGQGGAGHQNPVGRGDHRRGQGLGGVDPVAAAGGVHHPAIEKGGLEPVDEIGIVLGVLVDGRQHRAPGRQHHPRPSVETAQRPLDPRPLGGTQGVGLVVQRGLQLPRQVEQRRLDRRDRLGGGARRGPHQVDGRPGGAFHAHLRRRGPGAQLFQHRHQEGLDRPHRADLAGAGGDAAAPAFAWQGGGGVQHRLQRRAGVVAIGQQLRQPRLQPTAAPPPPLRTADPAAHLGGLRAAEGGGEGAVGGVEQVVALVEHDPAQAAGLAVVLLPPRRPGAVEGRLAEHQGVVGDDDIGVLGGAHRLLDETGAVVGAAGVDAFAAPVDEVGGAGLGWRGHGEQRRQPGLEIAAGHVAVAAGPQPAGGQGEADQVGTAEPPGVHRILKVEQAGVVLAALAHHRLDRPDRRVRPDRVALALDLPLQGAGVGGDPHPGAVGLGPQGGGGQIGQGLADAGAGLGQHHHRLALAQAWLEGVGRLAGEHRLVGPGLVQAGALQQQRQPRRRRLGVDRPASGLAGRRLVLPLGDPRPDIQAVAPPGTAQGRGPQGPDCRRRPGPAGPTHHLGLGQGLLAARRRRQGQFVEQHNGRRPQHPGLGRGVARLGQAQRQGEADGRGGAEPRRPDEGEQLQHIEQARRPGRGGQAQPPGGHRGVREQHRAALEQVAGVGHADRPRRPAVGHARTSAGQDNQGRGEIQGGDGGGHSR